MNPETLKALQESIAHHERLRDGVENEVFGRDGCALCLLFNQLPVSHQTCVGCPVYEKTGVKFCVDTPYKHQVVLFYCVNNPKEALEQYNKKWTDVCQAEIEFLKSLLP